MAHQIGFVDNTGSEGLAHWQMLLTIKTLAEANGWVTQRYNAPTDGSPREWIAKGVGLSGTEEIYIGFRCYHSVSADYYNMAAAVFTGYVVDLTWENQPGKQDFAFAGHNQRIDYWLAVNGQRVLIGMKLGTPVYEIAYAGKFFPYSMPGQYPYPVAAIGTMASGMPAMRYSDITAAHGCGGKGYYSISGVGTAGAPNAAMRRIDGTWKNFTTLQYTADYNNSPALRRDTGGYYASMPITLMDKILTGDIAQNVFGELDGLRYISGFNNLTENTVTIGGVLHVALQDVFRTGIGDFFLLEMN